MINPQKQAWSCLAVGLLVSAMLMVAGCNGTRVTVGHYPDDPDRHHEEEYKHREHRGGPPPWAPAHGYRAKKYRYFPSAQIYFDLQRDVYFYYSNGEWQVSASLPGRIRAQLGEHITLEMGTDEPYRYHSEVVKKYPPGRSRGRGKGKRR